MVPMIDRPIAYNKARLLQRSQGAPRPPERSRAPDAQSGCLVLGRQRGTSEDVRSLTCPRPRVLLLCQRRLAAGAIRSASLAVLCPSALRLVGFSHSGSEWRQLVRKPRQRNLQGACGSHLISLMAVLKDKTSQLTGRQILGWRSPQATAHTYAPTSCQCREPRGRLLLPEPRADEWVPLYPDASAEPWPAGDVPVGCWCARSGGKDVLVTATATNVFAA